MSAASPGQVCHEEGTARCYKVWHSVDPLQPILPSVGHLVGILRPESVNTGAESTTPCARAAEAICAEAICAARDSIAKGIILLLISSYYVLGTSPAVGW